MIAEEEESNALKGEPTKLKKPRRKRTSVRRSFTKPKKRGLYKPKSSGAPTLPNIATGNHDLAECLLSDEEDRADYLQDIQSVATNIQSNIADESNGESSLDRPGCSYPTETSGSLSSLLTDSVDDIGEQHSDLGTAMGNVPPEGGLGSSPATLPDIYMETAILESISLPSPDVNIGPELDMEIHPHHSTADVGEPASTVTLELVEKALTNLRSTLPSSWTPIADKSGIHLLQICDPPIKAVRKQVSLNFDGTERILVHSAPLPFAKDILSSVSPKAVKLEERSLETFTQRGCKIVQHIYRYDLCVGANDKTKRILWDSAPGSYVDLNVFGEEKYDETCRSTSCQRLIVLGKGKRCSACFKLQNILRKRQLPSDTPHPSTNNRFLTFDQAQLKLKLQQEEIRKKDKQIAYLLKRINLLLEDEGVDIEKNTSDDLSLILATSELSEVQRLFLEEQFKYAGKGDKRGMRWHPTMIRLALSIRMISSSAYEALRDSGAINLPSSRTLYDYSRPFPPQVGVSEGLLKMNAEKVSKIQHPRKYVTLIVDEVYVSRNLVYRESDGVLLGYVHLEEVEKELARFENCLNGEEATVTSHLANKILAYMIKGILSNVKCVIAAYPCNQLSKDTLFSRTWHVISRLERAGIPVLVVVSDGCSVNRAFIRMHKAVTTTNSGVVFDTRNMCAPDGRTLFFMSDVAHLIKTIRNCFYNSGVGEKKTRCLEIDGENIVWATIVRLYHYKQFNLRKSYKLSALNVFPNSYSCMKVHLAAEVISDTVALDIEQQHWANTTQTVKFLRMHNKFFDILNGAHSSQHIRTKNQNLAPYTDLHDPRFHWLSKTYLEEYLQYWRNQVRAQPIRPQDQNRKMLSAQTQEGIEIATKGFIGACKYLLEEAEKHSTKIFVMARAFSQDDLEHHFSRQRAAGGGNKNMHVSQFLGNEVSIGIIRDVGLKRRGSNVHGQGRLEVTTDILAKRRRTT